ncbi:MFS transporter [Modicisalibacter radicis]|uniref:MFS transporter n=1 Tax=Halomonas sp. EAR18 TaxID=2518972 RepID=UPI00109C78D1|nr:MFS transporter [Halomonas sp. EAR18]
MTSSLVNHAPQNTNATGPALIAAFLAIGLSGFAIGTSEFVVMGLLPDIAADLAISLPQAGHLVSAYAIGVMIGAPLFAVLGARVPRRRLLILLAGLHSLANLAALAADGQTYLLITRFAAGLPHGAYFGAAAVLGASLVPPANRGRAVGYVMLGLTMAMLVGTPLATWVGYAYGWRIAFGMIGAVCLLGAASIRFVVPQVSAQEGGSLSTELRSLANPRLWLALSVAGVGFGGMFCVFSYIAPLLTTVSGLSDSNLPFALALFGAGGVVGTLLGGRFADVALMRTIGGALLYTTLLLAVFSWLAGRVPTALLGTFLLGGIVSIGPGLQIWLMDVAGQAKTLGAALTHSAINFANALGAWLGGLTIAASGGFLSLGWTGALLGLGGLLLFGLAFATQNTSVPAGENNE